jgi:hypothetical protein
MGEIVKTDGLEHDAGDLLASWRQTFGKWYIKVHIWKSLEVMHKQKLWPEDVYLAIYVDNAKRVFPTKQRSGEFGQLHFSLDNIGAGIIAHEFRHFDWNYTDWKYSDCGITEKRMEHVCLLMGNLTKDFWNTFYEVFTDEKPGSHISGAAIK